MIRVLVVEDSEVVRRLLERVLLDSGQVELVGLAADGEVAVELAIATRPDAILMDLHLPKLDGLEAIGRIMRQAPCPIIVLSGELSRRDDVNLTFEALLAGAVEVLRKPEGLGAKPLEEFQANLVHTLRLMSQVKVLSRGHWPTKSTTEDLGLSRGSPDVVVVGASLGGPAVIHELLGALDPPLPVPLVIAQHISLGFAAVFARWLRETGHDVVVPTDGDTCEAGRVYVCGASDHTTFAARGSFASRPLEAATPAPNVDLLLRSAAAHYGDSAMGVLLTGMGSDGASGLAAMREVGAETVAQDEASCAVFGMPGAAVARGAARHILSPPEIATFIASAISKGRPS